MVDEVREGGGWRQGSESMPVWVATTVERGRVELSRWLPDEEHGVSHETLDVRVESLLHGDSGWRPADPGEAEEQLRRAQELYAAAAEALVERRRVSTSPSVIADMAARALELSRYAKPDPKDVARVREQIARAAGIPHVDYFGTGPTSAEAAGGVEGPWGCSECGQLNTAWATECGRCERAREATSGPALYSAEHGVISSGGGVEDVNLYRLRPEVLAWDCGVPGCGVALRDGDAESLVRAARAHMAKHTVSGMAAEVDEARARLRSRLRTQPEAEQDPPPPAGVMVGGGPGPRSVPDVLRALQDMRRFLIGQGAGVIGLVEAAEGHLSELHGPAFKVWRCDECGNLLPCAVAEPGHPMQEAQRDMVAQLHDVTLVLRPEEEGGRLRYVECRRKTPMDPYTAPPGTPLSEMYGPPHGPMRLVECRVTANG